MSIYTPAANYYFQIDTEIRRYLFNHPDLEISVRYSCEAILKLTDASKWSYRTPTDESALAIVEMILSFRDMFCHNGAADLWKILNSYDLVYLEAIGLRGGMTSCLPPPPPPPGTAADSRTPPPAATAAAAGIEDNNKSSKASTMEDKDDSDDEYNRPTQSPDASPERPKDENEDSDDEEEIVARLVNQTFNKAMVRPHFTVEDDDDDDEVNTPGEDEGMDKVPTWRSPAHKRPNTSVAPDAPKKINIPRPFVTK